MVREILFRGKRIDNGEWVEGYYGRFHNRPVVDKPDTHQIFEPKEDARMFGSVVGGLWHIIDPTTVGQYTGLTDKNGKRIFEGDILLVKTTRDSINEKTRNDEYITQGVVVFNEGHFELEGKGLVLCTYWGLKSLFAAAHFKEYEDIGNIHDNPELLEGNNE